MASDNVELKATVTSDAGAATKDIKVLGDTAKTTGEEVKKASSKFGELGERLGKMNPKELADRIMSITNSLSAVGDAMDAVATNDVKKFEASMNQSIQGIIGVVALVAPQFAPVVAIMAPLITRTLEWALGMEEAARAAKKLAEETENLKEKTQAQTEAIDQQMRMEKLRVQDRVAQLGIEVDAINRKSDLEQETYLKRLTQNNLTEEEIKAHSKFVEDTANELAFKQAEIVAEQQKQELAGIKEHNKNVEEINKEHLKTLEENKKDAAKSEKERIDEADEAAKHQEEIILHLEEVRQEAHEDELERNEKGQAALDARARAYEKAQQKMADAFKGANARIVADAKKSADEQIKIESVLAGKLGDIITSSIAEGVEKEKKGKTVLLDIAKKYSAASLSNLGSQIMQELALYAQESAAHGALAAGKMLSDKGTMASGFAAAFAPLGFFAVPAAAAAIAAMSALVNKFATVLKFAEGGAVAGRVPGLGRQDTVPGQLASDEGVLTGAGMATTLGQLLGAINKGVGSNGTALATAGAGTAGALDVRVSFDTPGGSDDSFVRWVMDRINVRVTQRNAPLVASRYHSQNGRAI